MTAFAACRCLCCKTAQVFSEVSAHAARSSHYFGGQREDLITASTTTYILNLAFSAQTKLAGHGSSLASGVFVRLADLKPGEVKRLLPDRWQPA